ncbi:MAG: hypothetical protein R3A13_02125 [Bdellovibrionota bacterium]
MRFSSTALLLLKSFRRPLGSDLFLLELQSQLEVSNSRSVYPFVYGNSK